MKKYLSFMLATAVLLVMTSFTKSTPNARVESVYDDYTFIVQSSQDNPVEIQTIEDYNYQPAIQESFVFTNNEELCQVLGRVQSQAGYSVFINNSPVSTNINIEIIYNYVPRELQNNIWYNYPYKAGI